MKQVIPSIPGYRLNEYLLILNPHEELRTRIMKEKKEFSETYNAPAAMWGKPHLALVNFRTWSMMEEKIMHRLQTVAMGIAPFKVELKDFGSFPSHTIFINIPTRVPIEKLVKELKSAQRLMKADPEFDPHFIAEPYIPISRKLLPWQYEKSWLEYSHRHFTAKFIADGMLLLKRGNREGPYQVLRRLEFMNLPVTTKQGELFS